MKYSNHINIADFFCTKSVFLVALDACYSVLCRETLIRMHEMKILHILYRIKLILNSFLKYLNENNIHAYFRIQLKCVIYLLFS